MNSKTSASYWLSRIYFHDEKCKSSEPFYSVKIQFEGWRERFSLGSPNREIAARTAAEIYRTIKTAGWARAIAVYKKEQTTLDKGLTIGEYLGAVRKNWAGSETTLNLYIRGLRKIVSEIFNLDPQNKRFSYVSPAAAQWHARIDRVPLSAITEARVNKWKMDFYARAKESEVARNKRKITINTYLRNARSLFAKRIVKLTGFELPSPVPFAGIELFGGVDQRYFSSFDIRRVLDAAREKLAPFDPDAYSVVLLSAFAGLRRREMDLLEWPSIDFEHEMIQLRRTEFYAPKTPDSLRPIPFRTLLVLDWFKERKASSWDHPDGFVLAPGVAYRKDERMDYYRCDELFDRVAKWLRTHGVNDERPLHSLRKEAGSDIVKRAGLVAGASFLRHKTTAVTAQHYSDYGVIETPNFGGSTACAENVIPFKKQ